MDTLNKIAVGQYYLCQNPENRLDVNGRMEITDITIRLDPTINQWDTVVTYRFISAKTGESQVVEQKSEYMLDTIDWLHPLTAQEWDTYEMMDVWGTEDDDPYKVVRDAEDQPPDAYVKDWDPTDALAKTLTAIREEAAGLQESFADLDAFGAPSECGKDVMRGYKHRMREIVLEHYVMLDDFCDEYNVRVDPAWRMANGMPEVWKAGHKVYIE